MRSGRELDADEVFGVDGTGGEHDCHDADTGMAGTGSEAGLHETGAQLVQLEAGGAQAGELNDGIGAEKKAGGDGEGEEIKMLGGQVFAELTRGETELVEELVGEEMDLGEVGRGGIAADQIAMADGGAAVGVTFNAEAGEEMDGGLGELGEGVRGVEVDGGDGGWRHF